MTTDSTRPGSSFTEDEHFLCDDWFDPLENGAWTRIRGFMGIVGGMGCAKFVALFFGVTEQKRA